MTMFITPEELYSVIDRRVLQVVSGDKTEFCEQAIDAAVAEAKSYLHARYDTDAIFKATGSDRHSLLVGLIKSMAVYHLSQRSNFELLHETAKARYDRAIEWLSQVAGIDPQRRIDADLPLRKTEAGDVIPRMRCGSNPKFTHSF